MKGKHRKPLAARFEQHMESGPDWWVTVKCQAVVTLAIMCVPLFSLGLGCLIWVL